MILSVIMKLLVSLLNNFFSSYFIKIRLKICIFQKNAKSLILIHSIIPQKFENNFLIKFKKN